MARLTAKRRKSLPKKDFALGKKYPDDTKARARNALSRIAQFGTPSQIKKVKAKVRAKYPGIAVGGKKKKGAKSRKKK